MALPFYDKTKLLAKEPKMSPQPSTSTNNMSLKGIEIIMGDNIIMPIDINTLATINRSRQTGCRSKSRW